MSHRMQSAAARTHANAPSQPLVNGLDGIRGRATRALIDANSLDIAQENSKNESGRALVRGLISDLQRSQKATAITAGCADSDFSAALSGRQRFDVDWITQQDDAFVIEFAHRLLKSRNALPTNKRQARMATAMALMQQLVEAIEGDGE